jgi:predicted nucleic acid-binding Zn ribbon protein
MFVGRCPRHGEFETLMQRWEPLLACPKCGKVVEHEATAAGVRFNGEGFQTPRSAPKVDAGTAKLKQNKY